MTSARSYTETFSAYLVHLGGERVSSGFGSLDIAGDKISLTLNDRKKVPEIARLVVGSGADLHSFTLRGDSLEELFVALMEGEAD